MKKVKATKLLRIIPLIMLLIVGAVMIIPATAHVQAIVSVQPASIVDLYTIGEEFTIDITVTDVVSPALWGWQAGMTFNPAVLEALSFVEGPFLATGGTTLWVPGTINNLAGEITYYGCTLTAGSTPVTGSGTLASVTFRVKDYGTSALALASVRLIDSVYVPFLDQADPHDDAEHVLDGSFTLSPPPPASPEARFTFSPLAPYAGDTVTFDATGSIDGWDGTGWQAITSWDWDFGDLSTDSGEVVTHVYDVEGTYTVTLTVTAAGNPAGYQTDTEIKSVKVYAVVVGTAVDLYTEKIIMGTSQFRGLGPTAPGSAFAPGEYVDLYVHVTYGGEDMGGVNVAFQVNYPDGTVFQVASATTDFLGIATIGFRMDQSPLPPFGAYLATATATIYGELGYDTLEFNVGWIVEIVSVYSSDELGVPQTTFTKGAPAYFNVTYKNIDPNDAYRAVIVVNLFDRIGQSMGIAFIDINVAPGSDFAIIGVTIKTNAVSGPAMAKNNAYTDWPAVGGVPHCPEVLAAFEIA